MVLYHPTETVLGERLVGRKKKIVDIYRYLSGGPDEMSCEGMEVRERNTHTEREEKYRLSYTLEGLYTPYSINSCALLIKSHFSDNSALQKPSFCKVLVQLKGRQVCIKKRPFLMDYESC